MIGFGDSIEAVEGETINVVFNIRPPVTTETTVHYTIEEETADFNDYEIIGGSVVGNFRAVAVPAGANSGTIQFLIVDDNIIERTRDRFSPFLRPGDGYTLDLLNRALGVDIKEGVCDRTSSVRTKIQEAAGVSDCSDVREIPRLTTMSLQGVTDVRSYKKDDFTNSILNLLPLRTLEISGHPILTDLEVGVFGVFGNFRSLTELQLTNNPSLRQLEARLFDGTSGLRRLWLYDNGLTSVDSPGNRWLLQNRLFTRLTNLERLRLDGNDLTTLPGVGDAGHRPFTGLGRLQQLWLYDNQLRELPEDVFFDLSSLRSLQLHDNPGAPFRFTPGLEPVVDKTQELTSLLSANTAMVELKLREGAPYPLEFDLTADGVRLSANSMTIPAGSTRSETVTVTRNTGQDQVKIAFSALPPPPNNCDNDWKHQGQCFTGFEIADLPTIFFVYDGGPPRATTIRFASAPQDPGGYAEGEEIKVDVLFDRGLVIDPPIMEGDPSPTLALQIGADRRTARYVVGSNVAAGILSFVYTVRIGEFDDNGVSVARDGLQLNGVAITEPVGDRAVNQADTGVNSLLADFPDQKARAFLTISFERTSIETLEGETINAVFNFYPAVATPTTTVRYSIVDGTTSGGDYTPGSGSGEVVVPEGATSGTIQIFIVDDDIIERTRDRFTLRLVDSNDFTYLLGSPARTEVSIKEGVCDRTSSVRDFFVQEDAQASHCSDVSSVPRPSRILLARKNSVTTYKRDDFTDENLNKLPLSWLELSRHPMLATLPTGLFGNLLEQLRLNQNGLNLLPADLFAGLTNLQVLRLDQNSLTTLPEEPSLLAGDFVRLFTGLTSLQELWLRDNELATLSENQPFTDLVNLQRLRLDGNELNTLPENVFSGLSSLSSLHLHDNPGAPFRLTLGLEAFDKTQELAKLLDGTGAVVMVELTLRERAPYPLEFDLTPSGVQLSANSVTIPAGSSRSETITATRNTGQDRVRIDFSAPPPAPNTCRSSWKHQGQCFTGFEIVGAPTIDFVYDGMGPQVATIRFTSAPQDPGGYAEGEPINVDVVFDRRLVIDPPITEGSSSPTLALQIGNNRRTATYVVESNVGAGILSFVYTVRAGDFDGNGVSVAQDGLQLNGASVTEPVRDLDANVNGVNNFLADFPEQQVRASPSISFEDSEIRPDEGATMNAVFNFNAAVAMPTTVRYALMPGTANADDYVDVAGNGEIIVSESATSGTIQIFIRDDDIAEHVRDTFSLSLVDSDGYVLGSPTRIEVSIREGICDRTPQVAEAISQLGGQSHCSDVSDPSAITRLSIVNNPGLTTLKGGDFLELDGLQRLDLNNNGLTMLPAGIFVGVGNLTELRLNNNGLTTLPEGVFDGLGRLTGLWLNDNGLTTLSATVFSDLGSLDRLYVQRNQLSAWPASIFNGLSNLQTIDFGSNGITQLPDDIFADNGNLRNLRLDVNQLRELPEQVFFGLTRLENLIADRNRLIEVPAGAFSGYESLVALRFADNRLKSLPPGVFSDLKRVNWLRFHNNRLTALPSGVFKGVPSNLAALTLDGNPGAPFQLKLRLEFAGEEQAPTLTSEPVVLRATLREGAPYALEIGLQALSGTLSTTEVTIEAGSTWSGTFTVTRLQGENSVGVSFADVSPPPPPSSCASGQRRGGQCFSGLEIVSDAEFALDDQPPSTVSGVAITSAPLAGDTYAAGDPNEEIVVELEFSGEIDVVQANDGSWPSLALEVGDETRFAAYDEGASSNDKMVFRYKPQDDDVDDDGISVPDGALHLNAARILDGGVPVSLDLGGHAIRNAPNHKVKARALSFEESQIRPPEGATVNAVFNFNVAVTMPTTVRYALTPNTANADDYVAGSGEVIVPAGESSGTIQIFIVDDDLVERSRDTFRLNLVDSDDYELGSQTEIGFFITEGVCDRTPQIAEAITKIRNRNHCAEVNNPRFIRQLEIVDNPGLTTLKRGEFFELERLERLYLSNNGLTTLPEDVFNDIKNTLQRLRLNGNDLTTLPEGVFDALGRLTELRLDGNDLTTLPEGVFDNLGRLTELRLDGNDLTTLPEGVFDNLGSVLRLALSSNRLTALPKDTFTGLPSLRSLQLHDNPGAPFRLTLGLEPADEAANVNLKTLADLLSANTPAMVNLTLREGAPYPLTLALTATGVQLSTDQVTIPAGGTQSETITMTRNPVENQVRITLSEPLSPPNDCPEEEKHQGQCFTGFEIATEPVLDLAFDGMAPQVTTIQFTSTPQDPENGYIGGEAITVEVVFDRGLAILPITEGSPSQPDASSLTLALQVGANQRDATYVTESNVYVKASNALIGRLGFVYVVRIGDLDEDGVSVVRDGLRLNGATLTEPVGDLPANLANLGNEFLADFPEQKVRAFPTISFTDSDNRIWGGEGGVARAAFSLDSAPTMPVTVRYTFDHGTADAADYEAGSGEIVVPANATGGTIEIPIVDDDDIEPVRESFYVNLVDSAGYTLGNQTRLEVLIAEGVCDRTPQIRDRLSRGLSSCRDANISTINGIDELTLSARGIDRLKEKDFLQLRSLEKLYLHGNDLTTLPEGVFAGLGNLEILTLNGNELTTLPEGTFSGLSSLISLQLHDNPGAPFRLALGLEPAGETPNVNPERLSSLLSTSEPAMVNLTLHEGAPYPLALALTATGVQLSANSVTIPAGSTRSVTFTMTRTTSGNQVRVDFSEPTPPNDCDNDQRHQGQCYTGFEIAGVPTINFVYDGMAPQVATIRFTSTPEDPDGYAVREVIKVDVVFDRGLVISPITGGSSPPTLALQVGANRRTATYVVESNVSAGVLSFVYTVEAEDFDDDGVSVARDGLQLNGATVTEPVLSLPANLGVDDFLAGSPGQKVLGGFLPFVSFEVGESEIEPDEGATANAVFSFSAPPPRPITVRYTIDPGTTDVNDYMDVTGNGEVVVPVGETRGTIRIFIVDDEVIEFARDTFSLNLVDSDGYALGSPTRIEISIREGVCDRTPQVADAIRRGSHCSDVSDTRFITQLSIVNHSDLTALKRRDFFYLDRLVDLYLFNNRLTALPAGVFVGVGNLRRLRLDGNRLTTLPADIFDVLGRLEELWLRHNELTTLPEGVFDNLGSVLRLALNDNGLTALPEGAFTGLSSLRVLHLHDNPGAPFRLELNLEPADEAPNVNLKRLTSLLSADTPATVKLTLREGAPYPLTLALTASGVQLSANSVTIPAGSTQSETVTATPITGGNQVRIDFSEPPPPPGNCLDNWKHQGQCFPGLEIAGAPTINFVYDGGEPRVSAIRFASTPQDPDGYVGGETIRVDVVFDRGLVISPITEGSPSPTLALQIGADRRTATYVVGSNAAAGILSFVYPVTAEDFDENGVSVAPNGLQLNGVSVTEPVDDILANVGVGGFLTDFPGQKVSGNLPSVSFEKTEIEPAEGETINAVFNFSTAVARPIIVHYTIEHGTADADDYEAGSGEVVVPADASSGTIRIPIVDDAFVERPRDTFSLNLVDSDGYALGSSARVEISIREGVCDRTPQVQDAIREGSHCSDVSDPSAITRLSITNNSGLTTLKRGDFFYLDNLQSLDLSNNGLTALPEDVFDALGRLTELRLNDNDLTALPAGVFARLQALRRLQFQNNRVATWPASIFNGLSNLQTIDLGSNGITQLPDDIFADNGNLQNLLLGGNQLRELPEQAFFGLPQLRNLSVNNNRLTELPAGAFPGYRFLSRLRLSDNQLESLPPGLFSDLERANWVTFHNNRLTALPPGTFLGLTSNLRALSLGDNPGAPFQLKLRLEFAGEEQAPTLTAEPVVLRATLREGAPYALEIELQAVHGTLSTTEVTIEAGSTRSGTFTVTRLQGENSVAVSFADVSPPTPPNTCPSWQRRGGQCFSGLEIVSEAEFALDDQLLSAVSDVAITSAPLSGDTYTAGDPDEEIVVELEFSGEIDVIQANDGSWPSLALEVGNETRVAVYDDAASSTDKLVFRYKPQNDDVDDDGISVPDGALHLNAARILDAGVPVSLSLGRHAIQDNPGHKVSARNLRVLFEPGRILMVRGGAAAEMVSRAVTMRTEPELRGDETLVVSLSADGVRLVSPTGPVSLTPATNAVTVTVEATPQSNALGAVSATLDEGASSFGDALVTTEALAVEVVRGVNLSLSDLADQDSVEFLPGTPAEFRVTTDPMLEGDERVTVTVSVDPRLRLESAGSTLHDGNRLVLNAMNPDATVAVTTDIQGLDVIRGISASGAGENVGVVGAASLRVRVGRVNKVTVVLSPSPVVLSPSPVVEIQQGGNAMLRVTTVPRLAAGQDAVVSLTIEPDDAGLSFFTGIGALILDASSATVTVYLHQGAPDGDVGVAAASDAVIGNTAEVTSTVVRSQLVEVGVDGRSRVTLEATTPQVALSFTPAGVLELGLGASGTVELNLTGFMLRDSQTAEFEVSVEGAGLSLQGGVQMTRVSFAADEDTKPISVTASADAVPVGRLIVRPVGGVELAGGMETASLPIEAQQSVRLSFSPNRVEIPRSRSTQFEVVIDPPLVGDRQTTVTLTISKQGFAFGADRTQHEIGFDAGKSNETVTVAATAAPGSMATVDMEVTASSGVRTLELPTLGLRATVPRAALDLTPADGAPGDELVLNTGTGKAVRLSLPDLTLSGDHVAVFGASVEGEGLSLQGGTQVSLSARNMTAEVTVSASDRAESVGRLVVGPVEGVELSGEARAATLPIRVLQSVSLRFVPDLVEIQRGRDTQFVVEIDPPLAADRQTTVTLMISDQGFSQGFTFGAEDTRHEVTFDADESRETVRVAATAAIDSMASVTVENVRTSSGVDLGPLPSLTLKVTPPQVSVAFSPPNQLQLTSGDEASVELHLDGHSWIENQEIVLGVSADDEELEVNPPRVTLSEATPTATVQVSASRSAESGNLMVSAVSGAELVGDTQLPVVVEPRQLAVSFEPSAVRLVRGGAAGAIALTDVSLGVAPALEDDEELVLILTPDAASNLGVNPRDVPLNSGNRTADVTVNAGPATFSAEVTTSVNDAETSIGNAVVSSMPLMVEVVRGVELLLSDHAGQAAETLTLVAGESIEITVATSPPLEGNERVAVTLVVADGLTLPWGNELILTAANSSSLVRVRALSPGLDSADAVRASVPSEGENVGVVGELPSLGFVTELAGKVVVTLPSAQVEVQQGRSAMLRVETDPLLGMGQSVTVGLMIEPDDAGLSFAGGSFNTTVDLGEDQQSTDVEVFAAANANTGSRARVTATAMNVSAGLEVIINARSEATLEVTAPRVVLELTPDGGQPGEALVLDLGERKTVELNVITDFTLPQGQAASFEVSVSGDGLSLQGGTPNNPQVLEVNLNAANVPAEVTVVASDSADSIGELSVKALSGVELAGGAQAATLPVEVLQETSLRFDPTEVEIQRGRSTEFEVAISPSLVADRMVTVTLAISDQGFVQGFGFGAGRTQHETITFDADKSREMVMVATTAAIDSMASVSVEVVPSSGVRTSAPLPDVTLKATKPQVMVRFDLSPPHLTENSTGSVIISLQADGQAYRPVPNQMVRLSVAVKRGDLTLSTDPNPPAAGHSVVDISLSTDSPMAMVTIIAGMPGDGTLTVSSDSVELIGATELPITVRSPSDGTTLRIRVFLEGALE